MTPGAIAFTSYNEALIAGTNKTQAKIDSWVVLCHARYLDMSLKDIKAKADELRVDPGKGNRRSTDAYISALVEYHRKEAEAFYRK